MRVAPLGQTYQHLGEHWMWFSLLELWTNSHTGSMRASWMQKNSQQAALPLACTARPRSGVFEEKAGKSDTTVGSCQQKQLRVVCLFSAITNLILIDLILGFGTLTNWLWKNNTEKVSIQFPNRPWNPHIAQNNCQTQKPLTVGNPNLCHQKALCLVPSTRPFLRMTCKPKDWKKSIKTRTCLLKGWGEAYIPSHIHCTITITFFTTDKCWNGYKHEPVALDGWTSQ